jgi:ATP-dependent DNA helicase DinG
MANDVREKTLNIIEDAIYQNEHFFLTLAMSVSAETGSDKKAIEKTADVMREGRKLQDLISSLEEELVFESEMYVINDYDLKIVEEYLEQISYSLSLFLKDLKGITWFEDHNGERTLVIMPRMVEDIMREEVFSQNKPFVFSSATLSENKSFDYMAKSLGVNEYLSFTVESPFDYEENMSISMPEFAEDEAAEKMEYTIGQIRKSEGRALVLFTNRSDLAEFKAYAAGKMDVPFFFEGDAEISTLVSNFQNDEQSVLCSVNLWEGLDIPGRSLENVIIFGLPFPPHDPVFTAKREGAADPFREVDLPYMILRLRQGIGRLIRTHEDKGTVHILVNENENPEVLEMIKKVLPTKASLSKQI